MNHYKRGEVAAFCKTKEKWGGLSNMAAGFPIVIPGIDIEILTSEALYQAMRFPHLPDFQREILAKRSPMGAKMHTKPRRSETIPTFEAWKTSIMRWCIDLKYICNRKAFSELLLSTGDLDIVEESHKDDFWGAKPSKNKPGVLVGLNVLGNMLTAKRNSLSKPLALYPTSVKQPEFVPNLMLLGVQIGDVRAPK